MTQKWDAKICQQHKSIIFSFLISFYISFLLHSFSTSSQYTNLGGSIYKPGSFVKIFLDKVSTLIMEWTPHNLLLWVFTNDYPRSLIIRLGRLHEIWGRVLAITGVATLNGVATPEVQTLWRHTAALSNGFRCVPLQLHFISLVWWLVLKL